MKQLFLKVFVLFLATGLIISACNKKEELFPDDLSEQTSNASDDAVVQNETEQAVEEASQLLGGTKSTSGARIAELPSVCGATVDWSDTINNKITVTFDGTTECLGRKRSGKILIELQGALKWKMPLASAKMTFNDYKVSRVSDGKTISFNGNHIVTNLKGYSLKELIAGVTDSLVYVVRGNQQITFDNGKTATWYSAQKRIITKNGSDFNVSLSGDTSVNNIGSVVVWGNNRNGNPFYSQINETINLNSCNSSTSKWTVISGKKTHKGLAREISLTFGVDQSGNAVNSCQAYGYMVNWTNLKGEAKQAVIRY